METLLAEQAVIGCMLMAPDASEIVYRMLAPKMFSEAPYQVVFNCCMKLHKRNEPIDLATVEGKIGNEYRRLLVECAETTPSISRLPDYAAIVLDRWREREMRAAAMDIQLCVGDTAELLKRFRVVVDQQEKIASVLNDSSVKDFVTAALDFLSDLQKPDDSIKTGWSDFDRVIGGLRRKSVVVISARPGKGKTDFALQLATQIARTHQVSYNTMEMPTEQLLERVASRATRINSIKIRDRELTKEEQSQIAAALDAQSKCLKINFDEAPAITSDLVVGKIAKYHPDVLVIDHLGLMSTTEQKRNQWEAIAKTTHELKTIALKHNLCIIELVQLNRAADSRKATQGDMYGGSAVEQDADVVIAIETAQIEGFLSGDEYVEVTANVLKNRHGATGGLKYAWQPQYHMYRQIETRYK